MEETKVEKQTVTIDGVEYDYDTLSDTAKVSIKHIRQLDVKIETLNYDLDEVKVARLGFISILKSEIESNKE